MNKLLLLSLFIFTCLACDNSKEKLLEEFRLIDQLIEDKEYEQVYERIDPKSQEFINYLMDSTNLNYESMKQYGLEKNLLMFTTRFGKTFEGAGELIHENKDMFMSYLALNNIPMFTSSEGYRIVEDQTVAGLDSYVVIARKVNTKAYLTSKIKFRYSEDGTYKLNLLDLMSFQEKLLVKSFDKFKIANRDKMKKDGIMSSDMLSYYLDSSEGFSSDPVTFRYNLGKTN